MSNDNNIRVRALKVFEILSNETDENNPMGTTDLIRKLSESGMQCERKTIYRLIKDLNDSGFEVLCERGKSNKYYVVDRKFDVPELRILIDAVQSASFITKKKTKELIDKIANLGGSNRSRILKNTTCFDVEKSRNENIYYIVSLLDEGIVSKKQVSFLYFDYDENTRRIYRKDGSRYIINPLTLVFNENNYYLVGYNDKYKNISSYRVDRMESVQVESKNITKAECAEKFNIVNYRQEAFSMYAGDSETIEIIFDKKIIDIIRDKFGINTRIRLAGNEKCKATVKVIVSDVFFGWCCMLGIRMQIEKPQHIADKYRKYLESILNSKNI